VAPRPCGLGSGSRTWARRKMITVAVSHSPTPRIVQAPPANGLQVAGAVIAIAFALAAAVLGYRIIRGGRGL
jgi:hypothetical protein